MKKIFDVIRHNRLYAVLLLFILGVNLLSFTGMVAERGRKAEETAVHEEPLSGEEAHLKEKVLFDEEDIKARQEKLMRLADENPLLYQFLGILNLLVVFIIFIGLFLDVYFFIRWREGKPLMLSGKVSCETSVESKNNGAAESRIRSIDNPRWSISDIVRVILIFVSFSYVFVILQSFAANLFPLLYNENFRMIFSTAVMNVVGIGVILFFVIRKYGQKPAAIGLAPGRVINNVFYAVTGYIALIPVLIVIMVITFFVTKLLKYQPPVQPIVQVFIEEKQTSILWISALFAAIFGPIAEEIFFRGFMYTAIRKKAGILWGMIITASIFSLLHTHIVGFFPILALGLLLAYLYEKTGSLVASITVHIIHNVSMVILVFLMRYLGG